ncbi:peptidase domain-containing ABC transporter [Caenimonas koreensis]|uniref:peptidase domain-containing ABC transporter n=1 Tax=Caenimonas koreensis TaxID=367474 RepID=UPI003784E82C
MTLSHRAQDFLGSLSFFGRKQLPLLLQGATAECGLTCLAMVASFHGRPIDIAELRRSFPISTRGLTLRSMIAMASRMGFSSRPLKVPMSKLAELVMPCVLHWDMKHFVVLKSVRGDTLVVHDPAAGRRKISFDEASRHFTGIALEVSPLPTEILPSKRVPIGFTDVVGTVRGAAPAIALLLGVGLVAQLLSLTGPIMIQWVVDEAVSTTNSDLLITIGIGFSLLVALHAAIFCARSWVSTNSTMQLMMQWLSNTFAHLVRLPTSYFETRNPADIVARFESISAVRRILSQQFTDAALDGVFAVVILAAMFLYSPALAAISLAGVALCIAIKAAFLRRLRELGAEQLLAESQQRSYLIETARGIQSVKLFGREAQRHIAWENKLVDMVNAETRAARLLTLQQTLIFLSSGIERVIVVVVAGMAVVDRKFTAGMLVAYISYREQLFQRVLLAIERAFDYKLLSVHFERIADVVHEVREPRDEIAAEARPRSEFPPTIHLENISVRAGFDEPWILKGLSLQIDRGESIVLTGPSGSGKSTLVKVLVGLSTPQEGAMRVDGKTLKSYGAEAYRREVASVLQEDHLFAGSILDNISFFDLDPDMEEIERCARAAAIHDDICRMPMGYFTFAGTVGSGLSGGQKQRILIARALYHGPSILILDEATSQLDQASERRIMENIRSMNITRVTVAHRQETIGLADRVVRIEHGEIVSDTRSVETTEIEYEQSL